MIKNTSRTFAKYRSDPASGKLMRRKRKKRPKPPGLRFVAIRQPCYCDATLNKRGIPWNSFARCPLPAKFKDLVTGFRVCGKHANQLERNQRATAMASAYGTKRP